MSNPVAPLPIDERPPSGGRRRIDVRFVLLLAVVGAAASLLWPSDDSASPVEGTAVPLTSAQPSPTTVLGPTETETSPTEESPPGPDRPAPASRSATVEPSANLPAQATVVVSADQPFLARAEAGVGFCVAGVEDACTAVPTSDHVLTGQRNQLTLVLPRTFTTWDGDRHDCVDDTPCEVRLWAQDGTVIEVSVPVKFAAEGPARPLDVEAEPVTALGADATVSVRLRADRTVAVLQCVVGLTGGCGAADDYVQQPAGTAELDVTVERRIFTSRGPYDCATGHCELRFVLADATYAEPVPLQFDPSTDLGLPAVTVRPSLRLAHGTEVELRTPNQRSGVAGYSLCAPDEFVCAALGNRAASEELLIHLPRWIEDRVEPKVVDCATTPCVIRTLIAGEVIDTPVDFAGAPEAPPTATVVVARGTATSLRPGDDLAVAARGLFVMSADAVGPTGANLRFCESPDAPKARCVAAIGDGSGLRSDGSLSMTVTIPNFERRRGRIDADGNRTPFCIESCWVVVEPRVDVPGGAVQINLAPAAE